MTFQITISKNEKTCWLNEIGKGTCSNCEIWKDVASIIKVFHTGVNKEAFSPDRSSLDFCNSCISKMDYEVIHLDAKTKAEALKLFKAFAVGQLI